MNAPLGVGVIGCGNISAAYLSLAPLFRGFEIRACADIDPAAAVARAEAFSIRSGDVADLLAAPDIDIVVNLTIPAAHFEVSAQALEAGKHVYSEKPFVLSVDEGLALAETARAKGLRIGSAPDTFLGGAHQRMRALIDADVLGRIHSGTAHVMSGGMEHWHPNPDFFFKPGAGPILDVGPYYVTNLIQLLGPVARVAALARTPRATRVIASEPRRGETIDVETPTTLHALLAFERGAVVTLGASWDVWSHGHRPMELYGDDGVLIAPDPNFFGGEPTLIGRDGAPRALDAYDHPFARPNQRHAEGPMANYRAAGLADMAQAIAEDRPHRCSLELALHAVDVMTSILRSGETGEFVALKTRCDRPQPLGIEEASALLKPVSDTPPRGGAGGGRADA